VRRILIIAAVVGFAVGGTVTAGVVTLNRAGQPASAACRTTQVITSEAGTPIVVPSADGAQPRCTLRSGDGYQHSAGQGRAATVLQQAIALCTPRDVGAIDGRFGRRTEAALRLVQRDLGFAQNRQDGVYGPLTLARMWFYGANGCRRPAP
jgi:lysozyme family protein